MYTGPMEMLLVRPRDPQPGTSFTRIRTLTLPAVAAEFASVANVHVVHEGVEPLPSGGFDLIGITCDTTHCRRAYALADGFRRSGLPVLLGGTHPTVMPDEALEHCDAVVLGEVEGLGPAVAADLAAGRLTQRYQLPRPPKLSSIPVPDVDLLPAYQQHFAPYPMELTRGCRNACRFCFNRYIHGPGFRRCNLDQLVEQVRRRPERLLLCMDDNICNDPEHLAQFAERVAPLGRTWGGQATLELAEDRSLLRHLRRSGFAFTFLGLESFSGASLAGERKTFNRVDRYRAQLQRLRRHGVLPFAGIILGLDGDDPDIFRRTAQALERVAPVACAFTYPVPFPGTAYYSEMERQGRIVCRDTNLYDGHHVVVQPERMSVRELTRGYHRLAAAFFSWPAALSRLARYCVRPMGLPRGKLALSYLAVTHGYRRYHRRLARARTSTRR